ncbi:immunoglobulin superfamily member 3-like isoform X2 [Channa argus]|uniref:immunoglobulin superfamily member 3-like isoform X2 n=1 Tax=Channa argus TaxID=215402 RepID=UPI0035229A98
MKRPWDSLRRAGLLFCLGLLMHCGEARVHTEAQAGPLYRVVGSLLSISCNVSGFPSESTQKEFEFRIKKPAKPDFDINILSTSDEQFGYAVYSQRVKTNEITVKRVSPNSVFFEIHTLQKDDEGDYECTVINSESSFSGTYSAITTVKVIDNSLSVSSPDSSPLNYNEGDALTLTCQASSNTIQHTHLSFAWYLHKDGQKEAQPIISLDRDFTLIPGQGFEERYHAGLIRLDKIGEATYRLKMANLQLSDHGKIHCQAQEWIQDPDRSWYCIAQNEEEMAVNVKAREVVPDTSALVVRISAQPTVLHDGQELSLSCNIDTEKLQERFFSVAWLREGVELAQIGPTGVLSVGPEYSGRERDGEIRAARIADKTYRLILQPVRTEDQGEYMCRAWPQNRGQDGAFTQGAAQNSNTQLITISVKESGISVEMQSSLSVNEGDRLNLTCKVRGVKGQLSVTWQHKSSSTTQFISTISLSQEGVMERDGEFKNRKVRAIRPAPDTFTLELDEVTTSDSGVYQCAVSEWQTNSKTNSQSQSATVTVTPIDSLVKVFLISRNNKVTVGENVELMCRVKGPRVPLTLTWSLQRDSTLDSILTLYSDGSISWSGDQHRYQLKVENQKNQVIHYLLINGASLREAGSYQCAASLFLQNVNKKLPPSNRLAVMVENPVSKLVLTSPPSVTTTISKNIDIKCSVTSEPSASSRYAVRWLIKQQAESRLLLSLDKDAQVTFGPQVEVGLIQRISTRRTKGPTFELAVRQAEISDNGSYICEVAEWQQDPRGDWYKLSPVTKTTVVTVIEPEIKLSIGMDELELNVSRDFSIPCPINEQSSNESEFQVTWFWQKTKETKHRPIFTSYRNSTLQDRFGKDYQLRFEHPLPNQFQLTLLKPDSENSGIYFCEVEEWLPSLSHGWRKIAVEKSQNLTVNVQTDGTRSSETQCNSGTWIGIFAAFILCLLLVIFVLVLKICQSRGSEGKKSGQSLWAEQLPLSTQPGADD